MPETTETYQILEPKNNFTLVPHLWLFPGIIDEYHFYVLAQTISFNYVFKEVDFTNSYDCDVIEQQVTVKDASPFTMMYEKNTGTQVELLSQKELKDFFNLKWPNRCVFKQFEIYKQNTNQPVGSNDPEWSRLSLGSRDSETDGLVFDTTVAPTNGDRFEETYTFRVRARVDASRTIVAFKTIQVTIRICGLETVTTVGSVPWHLLVMRTDALNQDWLLTDKYESSDPLYCPVDTWEIRMVQEDIDALVPSVPDNEMTRNAWVYEEPTVGMIVRLFPSYEGNYTIYVMGSTVGR
jgi:hypothetical protein